MLVRPAFFQPASIAHPATSDSFLLHYAPLDSWHDAEHVFSVLPRSLAELDMLGRAPIRLMR